MTLKLRKIPNTPAPAPQASRAGLRTFHDRLLAWYRTHGRHDLPWRNTEDPYAIWLSEVMLQQTQVATVLERYYGPFLKTFPTIQHLAAAPREKVMKAWEGLGYYRRAGYLHEAAKRAHNGLPQDIETLRTLPGIGKNTAHAIAAFAYRQPVAILEANVKRIVARIFAWEHPSEQELWEGAETLLNARDAFHHNQAMMDLGALICTPRAPKCPVCPANNICAGQYAPEKYPAPKIRKQVPVRERIITVRRDQAGKLYLEKRSDALLGGLYGFAQGPVKKRVKSIGTVTQTYSHFKLVGHVTLEQVTGRMRGAGWFNLEQIAVLPLSRADHKVLALVAQGHTGQKKGTQAKRNLMAR